MSFLKLPFGYLLEHLSIIVLEAVTKDLLPQELGSTEPYPCTP